MMRNEASDPPLNHDHTAPFPSKARVVAGGRLNVRSRGSRRWMTIVLATLFAIGASYRMSWAIAPRHQQSTDDAYVSGNIVQVMPQIAGTVVTVGADDHQFVRVGQLVVELDDGDARIAVERVHVQLDNTVREVCERYAKTARLHTCIDRNSMRNYPDVLAAADQVHTAYLQLAYTKLPASVSGFVIKRLVELGQRVTPGQPLMAIAPLNELWVEANFTERQLAAIRVGQPATVKAHLNGGTVTYHGTVASLGAGTVSSFGLLPPQNATRDRVKVAQRVPVCIALDSHELVEHPLQIGLAMSVDVDTRERGDARPFVSECEFDR